MRALALPMCLYVFLVPAFLVSAFPVQAEPDSLGALAAETPIVALVSGTYVGQWSDGKPIIQMIQMLTPDMITTQRRAYSSSPVTFRLVGAGIFRDRHGNTLTLVSATRIRWADSEGRNSVLFDRSR